VKTATPVFFLAIFIIALPLISTAQANCRCECVDSRMRTICTSPLDTSVCSGACLGSTCLGFCAPHSAIAEQNRIEHESKKYEFRAVTPRKNTLEVAQ
jgi:hypothetical protein